MIMYDMMLSPHHHSLSLSLHITIIHSVILLHHKIYVYIRITNILLNSIESSLIASLQGHPNIHSARCFVLIEKRA